MCFPTAGIQNSGNQEVNSRVASYSTFNDTISLPPTHTKLRRPETQDILAVSTKLAPGLKTLNREEGSQNTDAVTSDYRNRSKPLKVRVTTCWRAET